MKFFLQCILFIFVAITVVFCFFPSVIVDVIICNQLSEQGMINLLTAIDILFGILLALYKLGEEKYIKKRCRCLFRIEDESLSFQNYRAFQTGIDDTYFYKCYRGNDDIESPFYLVKVYLDEMRIRGFNLPLTLQIITELSIRRIAFSRLSIYVNNCDRIERKKRILKFLDIENQIERDKKYLIRFQLLCDKDLEKVILNSIMFFSFKITMYDDKGRKQKMFFLFRIQNVMGKSEIMSISESHDFFTEICQKLKLMRLLHKLSKEPYF